MADITMCRGEGCSAASNCYRHAAVPTDGRQAYFLVPPGRDETCGYFWQMFAEPPEGGREEQTR